MGRFAGLGAVKAGNGFQRNFFPLGKHKVKVSLIKDHEKEDTGEAFYILAGTITESNNPSVPCDDTEYSHTTKYRGVSSEQLNMARKDIKGIASAMSGLRAGEDPPGVEGAEELDAWWDETTTLIASEAAQEEVKGTMLELTVWEHTSQRTGKKFNKHAWAPLFTDEG